MRRVYLTDKERNYLKETGFAKTKKGVKNKIRKLEVHIHQKKKAKYLTGLSALPEKLKQRNRTLSLRRNGIDWH